MKRKTKPNKNPRKRRIGPGFQNKRGYWEISLRGKKQSLHRLIWEATHGPIPPGYHIHHIDENKANCALSNLECLPGGVHSRKHLLGQRPSHRTLPDGTPAKECRRCYEVLPLTEFYCYKAASSDRPAYRPYCRSCYYWEYGYGKQLLEQ